MTIYKAVRNFLTVFVVLAVAAGALCVGGGVYYAVQSAASSQVLSKLGSTGAEVTRVQKKLKELGYYSGAADGIYGNATKAAVKAFQKNCGITADGVAGPKTLLYLGLGGNSSGNSTGYSDADVELLAKVISAEARGLEMEAKSKKEPSSSPNQTVFISMSHFISLKPSSDISSATASGSSNPSRIES